MILLRNEGNTTDILQIFSDKFLIVMHTCQEDEKVLSFRASKRKDFTKIMLDPRGGVA